MLVCYRRSYYIRVYIYIYRHNSLFSYITIFHTVIKTAYYSNDSIGAKLTFLGEAERGAGGSNGSRSSEVRVWGRVFELSTRSSVAKRSLSVDSNSPENSLYLRLGLEIKQ